MTNPTVLVVEDEPSFVEALTIGLRREGFHVEVAVDGVEVLAAEDAAIGAGQAGVNVFDGRAAYQDIVVTGLG